MEQDKDWKESLIEYFQKASCVCETDLPHGTHYILADTDANKSDGTELIGMIDKIIEAERTKAVEEDREVLASKLEERSHGDEPTDRLIGFSMAADFIRNHSKKV